jgi:hypothetical protein
MDTIDFHTKIEEYKKPKTIYDLMHFGEVGNKNYFVITPLMNAIEWIRNDDSIDYYEAFLETEEIINKVNYISRSLYPFEGRMNVSTGEKMVNETDSYENILLKQLFRLSEKDFNDLNLKNITQKLFGVTTYSELQAQYPPYVPFEIRDVIEFSGWFNHLPNFALKLRPMILTTWN